MAGTDKKWKLINNCLHNKSIVIVSYIGSLLNQVLTRCSSNCMGSMQQNETKRERFVQFFAFQNAGSVWSSCVVDSSPPSGAYMRRWTGSALAQVMVCRLFGAKPLPEPMLTYSQFDPLGKTSVKFESKYKTFHSRKCIWKYRLRNVGHFVHGRWVNVPLVVGRRHPDITAGLQIMRIRRHQL